ncbi:MAG TPA: EthD family reductase [Candidatus Polarisedimenticolia bacterium]|nr:EthD family reductase [Candidatus Polarisedimenticolia bacterium]
MVTSSWFMVLPEEFTPEMFEEWYLDTHTVVAKQCQDLRRYCISRTYAAQPPQAHGGVFRIAQLWWDTPEKLRDSFISYSGSAVRGDALLNMGGNPYMAITDDVQFDVARPATFDPFAGCYRGTADGAIVKVLAYGMSDDADIAQSYADSWANLGEDERLRGHVFGTSINRTLEIGRLPGASLPTEGQGFWDWMLELSFDSKQEAEAFLEGERFASLWRELKERSGETHLSVNRAQDIFLSVDPLRHVEA